MRSIAFLLSALLLAVTLTGCGKAPVYSSDAAIKRYVQSQITPKWPNAKLADFEVKKMTSVDGVDKREFSSRIQSSDSGDPVHISGHVSFDKGAGSSEYHYDLKYRD